MSAMFASGDFLQSLNKNNAVLIVKAVNVQKDGQFACKLLSLNKCVICGFIFADNILWISAVVVCCGTHVQTHTLGTEFKHPCNTIITHNISKNYKKRETQRPIFYHPTKDTHTHS